MAECMIPAGFLGPSVLGLGLLNGSGTVVNASGSTLLAGEVVRVNGADTVTRARANILDNTLDVVGVMRAQTAVNARGQVANFGYSFVLLEGGLVPANGDELWLSATTAGRATNVQPALPFPLGVILDASLYATLGGVIANLAPVAVAPWSQFRTLLLYPGDLSASRSSNRIPVPLWADRVTLYIGCTAAGLPEGRFVPKHCGSAADPGTEMGVNDGQSIDLMPVNGAEQYKRLGMELDGATHFAVDYDRVGGGANAAVTDHLNQGNAFVTFYHS